MTLRNIKKSYKNYLAYYVSSAFSVFVIYLFMSILNNKNIQDELGSAKKFIVLFNVGAVMVVIFSAFFIWYSNSFFIRSRKKEFATYMLLGMSKSQVARLNFFENIIVMVFSLFTGILLGILFNKFFIMLLFYMIKSSAAVPFQWNLKALKVCTVVFLAIFLLITLHGTFLIRKSSLLELFNAAKKVERGLKVSVITFIFGIAAIVCLAYGYYIAVDKLALNLLKAPIVVALVVLGTVLFFTSTTSIVIHLNKKNEKGLFKGTKLITTAQLYYRYRGNVGTLSIIAVCTTIALCALVTCVGSYSKTEENSRYMRPMSVEYYNASGADKAFQDTLSKHSEVAVTDKDNLELLKITTIDPLLNMDMDFYVVKQSEFDKINQHENIDRKSELKGDEDCYFIQVQNFVTDKKALGKKMNLAVGKQNYSFNITGTDIKPFISMDHFRETIVVKDSIFNKMKTDIDKANIANITAYKLNNDFKAESFINDLSKVLPKECDMLTFYDHYKDGLKVLGIMAFIGLFIGLIFITATGSIIYFKMTMEAREDKDKYTVLSKIGVSRKEIKGAVSKELILLFGAPLIIAVVNSYPATVALEKMLSLKLMQSYIIIVMIYAAIYCIYYFVTLNSYMKSISEN
jgi:putative ABC transport system permease protein